jgi:predicted GNAT family N-acyltransferase
MEPITVKVVSYAEAMTAIQSIRYQVFQVEQGVDPALEFDGLDDTAIHLIAAHAGTAIGTARIRYLNDDLAKIERVAVLAAYRGQGIGKEIMAAAIDCLTQKGISQIKLNAQVQARTFYEKLGFQQRGDVFDEAGIAHIEMRWCP